MAAGLQVYGNSRARNIAREDHTMIFFQLLCFVVLSCSCAMGGFRHINNNMVHKNTMMDTNILDSITVLHTFCACSLVLISFSVIVGFGLMMAGICSPPDRGEPPPLLDLLVVETGALWRVPSVLSVLSVEARSVLSVLSVEARVRSVLDGR